MTFSIVIPTYNGSMYVDEAIQSALSQTRPADEIIVSDDNSSDNTIEICNKYKEKIKIYTNPKGPSGFVNGWNNAIEYANSDYISILHQDDLLAPTFLEEIEYALKKYPEVKHAFVPCNYINEVGEVISVPKYCNYEVKKYIGNEYVDAYQTIGHPHVHRCPGVVTHRDIFKKCHYEVSAGHIADDDFFYRVGQYTDVIGILKPLSSYRLHLMSETGHLEHKKLIERLAHDYTYQAKQWKNSVFLTTEQYQYFVKWAKYYVLEEIYYGVTTKDKELICIAKENIKELNRLGINVWGLLCQRIFNKIKNTTTTGYRKLRISVIRLFFVTKRIIRGGAKDWDNSPPSGHEVIGCSGLIQQCIKDGKSVDIVILTGGGKSHSGCCDLDEKVIIENRRGLSRKAAGILGLPLTNLHFLDYADGSISFGSPETDKLKQLIGDLHPDSIFVPHKGEGWSDHLEAGNIVRQLIAGKSNIQLYEYCVWFWFYNTCKIDWKNARIVRMNKEEHDMKLKAMDAYITPLAPCGKPWSGVLPKVFIEANQWDKELYFKVDR